MILINVILLLTCASVVLGNSYSEDLESALIGPNFCENGQVAWCQNFSTAIDCNAMKHCIDSVWLTQKPSSDDGSCGSCESEIEKIRQGIGSHTTKEVLKELLENVCDLTLITELFRKRCEKFIDQYVDNYFNNLLDLLKSDIDAATICHILGFCSNVETTAVRIEKVDDVVVRFENILLHLPENFINVHESEKLLGAAKCTWGPSYWCNNITSSKECKSTSHCIHDVWPKRQFAEDNDSVCKICKDMVNQARDQLQSNETQEELREVFEGTCKLIRIKEVRKECIKLADEFVPELTEMLVSEMNPTAVCTVAGLCNSAHIDSLLAAESSAAVGAAADSCTNCTAALTAVERYLHRAPRSQLLDKLLGLCDQMSSYSVMCADSVRSNINRIYDTLRKEMRPFAVCHLSGMCAQRYHLHSDMDDVALQSKVDSMLASADDDLPCDLCKQLVKHLKDVLTANSTEEEFHAMLQGICKHTGSFKEECSDIVDKNFEKIYKFLTEELDPSEVCREVNLCPKCNMVSDENLNLIYSRVSPPAVQNTRVATSSPNKSVKTVECKICKMVIQLVQKEMDDPIYEHNIEKILEKVCSLAPRSDREKCDEFVREYAKVLIEMLANETDPGIICATLSLCPNSRVPVTNDLCPICQYVMRLIQEELDKPDEQKKIEDIVRRICRFVPKIDQKECNSFVGDYAGLIISVLSNEMDPKLVCPALKLCSSRLSPLDSCIQCQQLMNTLVVGLGEDHSEHNVANVLRTLVPPKHDNLTLTALQLMVNHREDIIDMMSAEFSALESCAFLRFCDAETLSAVNVIGFSDIENGADASENGVEESNDILVEEQTQFVSDMRLVNVAKPSCELCELVVQMYEDELTSNATEKEIVDELQQFCDKIKNPDFRSNCSHFVQKYVPEVVKLLKKDVKPKDVCSLVKLCPLHEDDSRDIENGDRCELCEAVVGSLEGIAGDPEMVSESISSLIHLCKVFSEEKERMECMKIVSMVGPQLERAALSIPSWYVCSKVHLCPYGAHLTYKNVCSNQSQLCVDVKRAILCDQLMFCQRTVWKSEKPSP